MLITIIATLMQIISPTNLQRNLQATLLVPTDLDLREKLAEADMGKIIIASQAIAIIIAIMAMVMPSPQYRVLNQDQETLLTALPRSSLPPPLLLRITRSQKLVEIKMLPQRQMPSQNHI
tara:strand:+ start:147 stop:506 length:360 start_codon:yes stop_codon:yes gene_type:complete